MICASVRKVPPSGIRKYFDLINEMKDAISFGIGEPDFVTPWNIREAGIGSLEKGETHYSSNAGSIELRKEISQYIKKKTGVSYNPKSQVLVTVGASESIDIALRALVGPGDEVIIPEPSFVAYNGCTVFTGATPIVINLSADNTFKLIPQQLEDAITEKTKVVILPFPNNPTGAILSEEDVAALVDVLKNKDIIVISDEIYSELTYEGKHISIAFETLVKYKQKCKMNVYGWCLMGNHVHLLTGEGQEDISLTIKRIGISYAWYYNRKYQTIGHLFQDRYKSEKVEDDAYLMGVTRYIHRNPVKAGIVKEISEWEWSSFHYNDSHL